MCVAHNKIRIGGPDPPINLYIVLCIVHNERSQEKVVVVIIIIIIMDGVDNQL